MFVVVRICLPARRGGEIGKRCGLTKPLPALFDRASATRLNTNTYHPCQPVGGGLLYRRVVQQPGSMTGMPRFDPSRV